MKFALLLLSVHSAITFACNPYFSSEYFDVAKQQFIPVTRNTGISEEQYHAVLDRIQEVYAPLAEEQGATLQTIRKWEHAGVNAFANRKENDWTIDVLGGYARHPLTNVDAMYFISCHEIGHHFGGTPTYEHPLSWAAAEGQADYYSTLKCMRTILKDDDNERIVSQMDVPEIVQNQCEATYADRNDQLICQRAAIAGRQMLRVFENGDGDFKFSTPDPKVVNAITIMHPPHQCRLDTYFQGSLCPKDPNVQPSFTDPVIGTCNRSQGDTIGVRPFCWFKPFSPIVAFLASR